MKALKLTDQKITKQSIKDLIHPEIKEIENGHKSAAQLLHFATYLEAVAKEIISNDRIKELALIENNEMTYSINGVKYEPSETAIKYDYSSTEVWNNIENEIELLRSAQKEVEDMAKRLQPGASSEWIDQNGEVHIIHHAPKSSKSTIKKTIPTK